MGLTIKEAKNFRCEHVYCKTHHFTCRRCESHLPWSCEHGNILLCDECYRDYWVWMKSNYLEKAMKEWESMPDVEREMWLDRGYSPLFYNHRYAEFIKKCPIITIETCKLLED